MKKKILFLINEDSFFFSHRFEIGIKALKMGYDVHLASNSQLNEINKVLRKYFHFHYVNLSRGSMNIFKILRELKNIYQIIKIVKPDILHLITLKPILLGNIAARILKVRSVIISVSGLGYLYIQKNNFVEILQKFINFLLKILLSFKNIFIICQNKDDFSFFHQKIKVSKKKIYLIRGSGVNLKKFKQYKYPNNKKPIVLFPARFLIHKGILEFFEAAKVLKSNLSARFVIVGKTDNQNPASVDKKIIKRFVSKGIVENWGWKRNMQLVLKKADLIVLPSYREGLPKSLIEASAIGRPIITTNVPGCRESIINNKTGILIKSRNFLSLAKAIQLILSNKKLAIKMGNCARKFAEENFDVNEVAKKHIQIYEKVFK